MRNFKKLDFITIAIISTIILSLTCLYFYRDKIFKAKQNSAYNLYEQDLRILRDTKINPDHLYRAMIRLGKVKNDEAKISALNYVKNNNPMLRAAAYESLGFYPDEEVLKVLSEGLADPDKIVRMATVRGFGRQSTQPRIDVLTGRLNDKDILNNEKIEIYAVLGRIGGQKEIENAVAELVRIAQMESLDVSKDAAFRVAGLAPTDPRVIQLYKSKLESRDKRLMAFAIRHLSSTQDRDVIRKLREYSRDDSVEIRIAAVQSAALVCAEDRWEILNDLIKNEKSPQVLQAVIRATAMILGEKSVVFLQDLVTKSVLSSDLLELARETLIAVEKNKKNSRCE